MLMRDVNNGFAVVDSGLDAVLVFGRQGHLELFQQTAIPDQNFMLTPDAPNATPWKQFELALFVEIGDGAPGPVHDRNGEGMLRAGFRASSEIQDAFLGISACARNYLGDAGLAICECSSLVERDGVQVRHGLEVRAAFDQDPATCAVADGSADRGWSSQSRGAGTGNEKHRKGPAGIASDHEDERG